MISRRIITEAAIISFFSYLSLFIAEWLRPGFVSTLFDLNLFLLISLILLVAAVIRPTSGLSWSSWSKFYFAVWLTLIICGLGLIFWRQSAGNYTVRIFVLCCLMTAITALYFKLKVRVKE